MPPICNTMLSTEGSYQKVPPISFPMGGSSAPTCKKSRLGQLSGSVNPSQGHDAILQLSILSRSYRHSFT